MWKVVLIVSECMTFSLCHTEYLRNVLDDLDLPVSKTLTHVESLLWSDDGHFYDNVGGIPRQLVDKMAAIRGIEQPT